MPRFPTMMMPFWFVTKEETKRRAAGECTKLMTFFEKGMGGARCKPRNSVAGGGMPPIRSVSILYRIIKQPSLGDYIFQLTSCRVSNHNYQSQREH